MSKPNTTELNRSFPCPSLVCKNLQIVVFLLSHKFTHLAIFDRLDSCLRYFWLRTLLYWRPFCQGTFWLGTLLFWGPFWWGPFGWVPLARDPFVGDPQALYHTLEIFCIYWNLKSAAPNYAPFAIFSSFCLRGNGWGENGEGDIIWCSWF